MQLKKSVESEYERLKGIWQEHYRIADQKEFALAIKDKTRFSSILFQLRMVHKLDQTEEMLRGAWEKSEELICKVLGL